MGLIVFINYVVDAYGVTRKDFSRQFQEPNQGFIKMKYLLTHPDRFDSFVFGASTAYQIDNLKIPDGRYYNLASSEALPAEHLENIRLLLKRGVTVRNIVIALDDFSCQLRAAKHHDDLLWQPHYLISGKSKADFYSEYYVKLGRFFPSLGKYIRHNYTKSGKDEAQKILYDFERSGRAICLTCDDEIARDPGKHVRDPKFDKPRHYDGNSLDEAMKSMAELVRLASAEHIRLIVLINPVHQTTYLATDLELFFRFKKELAGLTPYFDFSGLNSVTTNNLYYHETSHFREAVGDMMLARIFGQPRVPLPADFGVLVTKENVDAHIEQQRREIAHFQAAAKPHVTSLLP